VPGRVPEHVISQIVRSVDFVRLAGRYCELKKRGRSYWGLCPFHKEKTPSFSVDPENGLYFCFGCKEGGNAFTLLQKLEGLSFAEALSRLAAEAGVDLKQYQGAAGPSRGELTKLREVNELAASFYQKCLEKAKGNEAARQFLTSRRISDESSRTWRLGYAPEGWDHFLKCALGRGYQAELLVKVGLALERQGAPGHYDRFRDRLMFPIADASGRTIGFGARALKPGDEPKYLNSPDTPLFSKGRCFFGLSHAKEAIRSGKTAVVLEGYTDVIMAHQCGVPEAVAVLGTALTEEHARALARLGGRVILVFDADEAGRKSATHSIEVLLNEDLEVYVADLPPGQDPCDYLMESGGEAFRQRLAASKGFFEFRLSVARAEHDMATLEGRMAAFRDVAQVALTVRDGARRDMIVRWLAHELGVRESSAWAYVRRHWSQRAAGTGLAEGRRAAAPPAEQAVPCELLGLMLVHPEIIPEVADRLETDLLADCHETGLVRMVLESRAAGQEWDTRRFLGSLADPELASIASRAIAEEQARDARIRETSVAERLQGYVDHLERKATTAARASVPADDEELRNYERKLREKDAKSAR